MALRHRVLATVCLFGLLAGSLVAFGAMDPSAAAWDFPREQDLATNYDAYVGERVVVYGRVVATDPLRIESDVVGENPRFTVEGVETPVAVGEEVEVYGVAGPDRTIAAIDVVVFRAGGPLYAYVVSALAGFWVLGRLLVGWRFDLETVTLGPRAGGWRPSRWW